jgi:general L-amino acid transport system substrate-binding protein
LSASARFPALLGGEIDVLIRNTTWTYGRDTALGLEFVAVTFYDGQGFMARTSLGVASLGELGPGVRVCFETSTTTARNLSDYAVSHGMRYEPVAFQSASESRMALFSGRCDLYTTDRSALVAIRGAHVPNPEDYVILTDIISKEPLGPVVRDDDPQWREIVQWVVFATIEAEEKGISSANVSERRNSPGNPAVAAMLGGTAGIGKGLGLDDEWVYRVIRQVGNYGEIFARNLGADTPLAMDRGLNALWTEGGLMYSPPLR